MTPQEHNDILTELAVVYHKLMGDKAHVIIVSLLREDGHLATVSSLDPENVTRLLHEVLDIRKRNDE